MTKLLVGSGMPINNNTFEIIDLSKPPALCNEIKGLPKDVYGAVGAYIPPVRLSLILKFLNKV